MRSYLPSAPGNCPREGLPLPSLIPERWADVSLTAGVTDTAARRPDELLSLFALLILLSTAAIQIKAHGPLGSRRGRPPKRCSTKSHCRRGCMSVCSKIDTASHSGRKEILLCISSVCCLDILEQIHENDY